MSCRCSKGSEGLPVSIDTSKAEVARRALELGAEMVNDVTALRGDSAMGTVVAEHGAYVCLMHMLGEPRTMQTSPHYDDVVAEVFAFLEERIAFAIDCGIAEERICIDPGIGFGKTPDQNLELVRRLDTLVGTRTPGRRRALAQEHARQGDGRRRRRPGNGRSVGRRRGRRVRARRLDAARTRRSVRLSRHLRLRLR